jgi:hypothetical protein
LAQRLSSAIDECSRLSRIGADGASPAVAALHKISLGHHNKNGI